MPCGYFTLAYLLVQAKHQHGMACLGGKSRPGLCRACGFIISLILCPLWESHNVPAVDKLAAKLPPLTLPSLCRFRRVRCFQRERGERPFRAVANGDCLRVNHSATFAASSTARASFIASSIKSTGSAKKAAV